MDEANTFSLKLHPLHSGLCFLFLTTVAKNIDETVQRITVLLTTFFRFFVMYFFLSMQNTLSLWSELCHTISVSVEYILALCPHQALLLGNARVYTLGKNSLHQKHFHLTSQGEKGMSSAETGVSICW